MKTTEKKNCYTLPMPNIPIAVLEQFSKLNNKSDLYKELLRLSSKYVDDIVLNNNLLPPIFKEINLNPYAASIYFVRESILETYETDILETLEDVIEYIASNNFWSARSLNPTSLMAPSKNRLIRYFELQFQIEQNWRRDEE